MPVFKAAVGIRLKRGVADPEGQNTKKALELLGFKCVTEVVSIKTFEITLKAKDQKQASAMVDDMCKRLLSNPVIHTFRVDLKKEGK